MAKIILTEKQVSYIFQKSLINEGFKKTFGEIIYDVYKSKRYKKRSMSRI